MYLNEAWDERDEYMNKLEEANKSMETVRAQMADKDVALNSFDLIKAERDELKTVLTNFMDDNDELEVILVNFKKENGELKTTLTNVMEKNDELKSELEEVSHSALISLKPISAERDEIKSEHSKYQEQYHNALEKLKTTIVPQSSKTQMK